MSTQINGINYFPVDVRIFEDDKLAVVESEYGILATAITIKLLCKIYSEGFYTPWNNRAAKLFRCKMRSNVTVEQINNVVNALIEEDFFDKEMYNNYQILTSKGIQSRFFEAISRRKRYKIEHEEYLLIEKESEKDVCKNEEIADTCSAAVDKFTKIVDKSNEIADNSKQRKEKKRKEKERKEEKTLTTSTTTACACAREKFSFKAFHAMLEHEEDWQSTLVRFSGKGLAVLEYMEEAMQIFDDFLLLSQRTHTIQTQQEYNQNFISWWRYHNFNLNMKELPFTIFV